MPNKSSKNQGADIPNRGVGTMHANEGGGNKRNLRDVMTPNPECVASGDSLERVAKLMVECDCGAIPVVESKGSRKPVGIITDRDIVVRCVAEGKNPLDSKVSDIMTDRIFSVRESESMDKVFQLMGEKQVRRVLVTDDKGDLIGIVAQADLAVDMNQDRKLSSTVEKISEPRAENRP